jgi:hypothetical protein
MSREREEPSGQPGRKERKELQEEHVELEQEERQGRASVLAELVEGTVIEGGQKSILVRGKDP